MATYGPIFGRPVWTRPNFLDALGDAARAVGRIAAGLAPLLGLYVLYTILRWVLTDRGPALGPRHAERLLDLEARLGLDWELSLHDFALRHDWIVRAANWYYVAAFLPVLVAAAVLAAWRAPAAFAWWRRVFALSLGLALVGFALFPMAPPRLLPAEYGFADTLMAYGPHYYGDAEGSSLFNAYGRIPSMVNEYAAMPSMHVAWSAVAGALLAVAIGRRWAWTLAILHPLLMALTVVVTANHYVLDVVGGLLALGIAMALATALPAVARRYVRRTRVVATPVRVRQGAMAKAA